MFRPFGTPSGPFGGAPASQPAAGGFSFGTPGFGNQQQGQAASTFGGSSNSGFGQVGFGAVPRYTPTNDTENNTTISIQAITAMPAHQKQSLEELRLEDYLAGRKGSTAPPFGAVGNAPSAAGFNAPQPSGFGAASNATATPFGTPLATGLFGQSQPPASGGAFGGAGNFFGTAQPAQNALSNPGGFGQGNSLISSAVQPPNSSGLFGNSTAASGGLFSNPAQNLHPPPSNAFSAFGKPPSAVLTAATNNNTNTAATPFSAFAPPAINSGAASLFGGGVQSGFGGGAGTAPSASTSISSNSFAKPASAFGGFGAASTGGTGVSLFGQSAGGGGGTLAPSGAFSFGGATQNAPAAQPASAFNFGSGALPGQNSNAAPSLFSLSNSAPPTNPASNQPNQSFSFSLGAPAASAMGTATGGGGGGASFGGGNAFSQPTASTGGFSFNMGGGSAAPPPQAPSLFSLNPGTNQASNLPLVSASSLSLSLSIKPPIPEGLSTPRSTPAATGTGAPNSSKASSGAARSPNHFTPRASFRLQPPAEAPSNHSAGALTTPAGFVLPRRVSAKKLVVNPTDRAVRLGGGTHAVCSSRGAESAVADVGGVEPPIFGEGDEPKFMIPSEATLRKLPYAQLSAVQNFTVGSRGIGQVRFLQPVDLTKILPSDIFERIVIFEPRQITVYPESEYDEEEKPAVGAGLNVPAEIRLEKCWPVSKANREPIKDMGDGRMQAHIERLKNIEGTKFVDYFPETGTWIFRVEHFSTYGLTDGGTEAGADPNICTNTGAAEGAGTGAGRGTGPKVTSMHQLGEHSEKVQCRKQ